MTDALGQPKTFNKVKIKQLAWFIQFHTKVRAKLYLKINHQIEDLHLQTLQNKISRLVILREPRLQERCVLGHDDLFTNFCRSLYICNSPLYSALCSRMYVQDLQTQWLAMPLCVPKSGRPKNGLSEIRVDYRFQSEPGLPLVNNCLPYFGVKNKTGILKITLFALLPPPPPRNHLTTTNQSVSWNSVAVSWSSS